MPNGPIMHRLLLQHPGPHNKTTAMVESYKFRRWKKCHRTPVLTHRGVHRIILRALNDLDLDIRRVVVEPQYRHSMRKPFPGVGIKAITTHINNRLWEHGWCIALDVNETRDFLKENFSKRMTEYNEILVGHNDEEDSRKTFKM